MTRCRKKGLILCLFLTENNKILLLLARTNFEGGNNYRVRMKDHVEAYYSILVKLYVKRVTENRDVAKKTWTAVLEDYNYEKGKTGFEGQLNRLTGEQSHN